jgi:hypothetical protein
MIYCCAHIEDIRSSARADTSTMILKGASNGGTEMQADISLACGSLQDPLKVKSMASSPGMRHSDGPFASSILQILGY